MKEHSRTVPDGRDTRPPTWFLGSVVVVLLSGIVWGGKTVLNFAIEGRAVARARSEVLRPISDSISAFGTVVRQATIILDNAIKRMDVYTKADSAHVGAARLNTLGDSLAYAATLDSARLSALLALPLTKPVQALVFTTLHDLGQERALWLRASSNFHSVERWRSALVATEADGRAELVAEEDATRRVAELEERVRGHEETAQTRDIWYWIAAVVVFGCFVGLQGVWSYATTGRLFPRPNPTNPRAASRGPSGASPDRVSLPRKRNSKQTDIPD